MSGPRHVLVTGAAGRIGRVVVEYLRSCGIAVTGLSDVPADGVKLERLVLGDATREEPVAEALAPSPGLPPVDAVVHMAGMPHRDTDRPLVVYGTNVVSTFNVLMQAAEAGVGRVVVAGSVNATGLALGNHDALPPYFPIDVQVPADLADWYSLSKASDELTAAMVVRRYGTSVTVLRLPHTNTTEGLAWYSGVVADDPASGVNEGWGYLHSRDAARACLLALTAGLDGLAVLQVAARDTLVPFPTAELLDRYAPGVPRRRAFAGRETALETATAERALGFEPEFALDLEERPLPQETAVR
ncbi:MAG TPA: NAD(P)-dependent oxidoreductase [Gaiellaceae bacterium]|nr:NAD(P)-dependent oxidoreductase [Gaiellaceae bacterium]